MLIRDQTKRYVTVPRHDPIKETTMRAILSRAGIEKEDFLKFSRGKGGNGNERKP